MSLQPSPHHRPRPVALRRRLIEASADLVPAGKLRPEILLRAIAEGRLLHGD